MPIAADGCSAIDAGSQGVMLQPDIIRSSSSPEAVKAGATASSATQQHPVSGQGARMAAKTFTGRPGQVVEGLEQQPHVERAGRGELGGVGALEADPPGRS